MARVVRIDLLPLGQSLEVPEGSALQDVLFHAGVEFPCGGRGRCKGCRIKVLSGELEIKPEERRVLSEQELAAGWRLACHGRATGHLKIQLAQWEAPVLTDQTTFAFVPREGLGVAVDLGTTTIAAQLLDLQTGQVLGVSTGLNHQARFGADIMSRVDFAVAAGRQAELEKLVREQIGRMIQELFRASGADAGRLRRVAVVGNSVMHHFFCGLDARPFFELPFETPTPGLQRFGPKDLGWELPAGVTIYFLPCMGSFVGSDILAGVAAVRMHERQELCALVDLGTNGEIVVGNRDRLICSSTAAGPAFEGARISMGMRAATGAIASVSREDGKLRCHVLGQAEPRGICGSGLVDAVAASLDLGWIKASGRMTTGEQIVLAPPVSLIQGDVRELQLAKGAIAAGVRLMLQKFGAGLEDVTCVYLAGAFGNYISLASARRIGLLPFAEGKVQPSGNTALLGAKMALFAADEGELAYADILKKVEHIALNLDEAFQEIYAEEMVFP